MTHRHHVEPFKLSHLVMIPGAWGWLKPELHAAYEQSPSWSGFCNQQLIGSLGIMCPFKGLGEAWCMVSPQGIAGRLHTIWFYRTVKQRILGIAEDMGLHRLQATVDTTMPAHVQFVEALGFAPEATLHKAGPQRQDYRIYVLFPEER